MKTFTNILLAMAFVSLLAACSKSDDDLALTPKQNTADQLKSNSRDVYNWLVGAGVLRYEIYCDNVLVDVATNNDDYMLKCRDKYKNGEWTSWSQHANNLLFTSEWTGELFRVQLGERGSYATVDHFGFVMVGDQGHRYIVHMIIDPNTWEAISYRAVCN